MPTTKIVEIISRTQIEYSESPLTPDSKVTQLTPAALGEKLGFEYDESIYHEVGININEYLQDSDISHPQDCPKIAAIEDRIKQPLDGLVVCRMAMPTGHGVFTRKAIKNGAVIGFYSGVVNKLTAQDNYAVPLGSPKNANFNHLAVISAKASGGISRLFQHLPFDYQKSVDEMAQNLPQATADKMGIPLATLNEMLKIKKIDIQQFSASMFQGSQEQDDMQTLELSAEAKNNIARANLNTKRLRYRGTVLSVIVATCDIPAYSQLGFCYGIRMWQSMKIKPLYFDLSGKILAGTDVKYILTDNEREIAKKARTHYEKAIEFNRVKKYANAIEYALLAQQEYIQTKSFYSIENAKTYNILAAFYRENDQLSEAIDAAVFSILIAETIKQPIEKDYEKLERLLQKLTAHLPNLSQLAVRHYKDGYHRLALTIFLGQLPHVPDTAEKATCLYNIASCYEKLADKKNACEYYQQAAAHLHCSVTLLGKANEKIAQLSNSALTI